MRKEKALKILLSPYLSEKSVKARESSHFYVFRVLRTASKLDIKSAIEMLFGVTVSSVRTVNVKSKPTHYRRVKGHHKAWKKAYVGLPASEKIDLDFGIE